MKRVLNEYELRFLESNHVNDSLQVYNVNSLILSQDIRGIRIIKYADDIEYTIMNEEE